MNTPPDDRAFLIFHQASQKLANNSAKSPSRILCQLVVDVNAATDRKSKLSAELSDYIQ